MRKILQDNRGFTLLEMLVVLTIVLVISSCVVFYSHEKLQNKLDYQLMNYTELLIRMTQMLSIEEQFPYMLTAVTAFNIKFHFNDGHFSWNNVVNYGMINNDILS